jgi:hypothetical protein
MNTLKVFQYKPRLINENMKKNHLHVKAIFVYHEKKGKFTNKEILETNKTEVKKLRIIKIRAVHS